ncbi:MAG: hypothetical protein U5R06_07985 [candidate division KSB1 bacterium]|nr:hypothetical protein [candidate division KSB1 bacterium]
MIFQKIRYGLFFLLLVTLNIAGSENIRSWKTITNLTDIEEMVLVGDEIWCATNGGVLTLDTRTKEFNSITNTEGLEGINITCIEYDARGYIWNCIK